MKLMKIRSAIIAVALSGIFHAPVQAQGIPVIDVASIVEALNQELNQLNQLKQQLIDYQMQVQNLQKLNGPIRGNVANNVKLQLNSNNRDFGISGTNSIARMDADPTKFYRNAETTLKSTVGAAPYTAAKLQQETADIGGVNAHPDALVDRERYDAMLDDMRQVSLARQNSEARTTQASAIADEMANLDSGNTVGAIQLLAAQNSLSYAQMEDLIKNQLLLLKNEQEKKAKELADAQKIREKQIKKAKDLKQNATP